MSMPIKNILLSNKIIKVISLIIGYSLWSFLGQIYTINQRINAPVCFYNVPDNMVITTHPEHLSLELAGKRSDLHACKETALHLNAKDLTPGTQMISAQPEELFLPRSVKLLQCNPIKVTVTLAHPPEPTQKIS